MKTCVCLTHDCKPVEGLSDVTVNILPKHGFLNYGLQMTSDTPLLILWPKKRSISAIENKKTRRTRSL